MKVKDLSGTEFKQFKKIVKSGIEDGQSSGEILERLYTATGHTFGLRTVQRYLAKWKDEQEDKQAEQSFRVEGKGEEEQEIELNSEKVVTVDDALRKGNVDRTKWDVERFVLNSWEVGAKGPDGRIRTSPLWQVKVWLKAKKGWDPSEFRKLISDDLRKLAPVYQTPEPEESDPNLLMELSLFDAHFGKLAWRLETTQDYDLHICKRRYMNAANDLLGRAVERRPSRIVYVVGNDFFHVDHKGLTTNGTPMDTDGRWQKAFRTGKDCAIEVIERATQIAPVDVVVVPGNHDREKAFTLGEVLDARFMNNHSVVVFNDPDLYKYYRWGKVLLGFVHGDNHTSDKKQAELPLQMATDRPVDWSETVWREWHLGHFHSEKEDVWKYRTVKAVRDVAVRVLPSLSSTDAWHREQGYASVLAAEAHYYHKQKGRYSYDVYQAETEPKQ